MCLFVLFNLSSTVTIAFALNIVNKPQWLGSPASIKGVNKDAKI